MKPMQRLLALLLMSVTPVSQAAYSCPPATNTGGGWIPDECLQVSCSNCGTVQSITMSEDGKASGLGAVLGAVAGGLLGNQIGGGSGKKIATVAGAVAGGVGGHYGEKALRKQAAWLVNIQMQDGSQRKITLEADPGLIEGDRVRVDGNVITKQ